MYCPNCCRLFEENVCPECGAMGRRPREDDYCYLCRLETIWAEMLTDVLRQNGIPSMKQSAEGAAIRALMGTALGKDDLYVPYACLEQAASLKDALLGAEPVAEDAGDDGKEEQ